MSVLDMGRRMAESRMTDTCTVTRAGERVWDEESGSWSAPVTEVFSGPCRVKHPVSSARDVDAGSQLAAVSSLEVHLPVSATGVQSGDVLTVTGSATRAEVVGRVFTISAPFDGSQTTALRFRVEVADGRA